MMHIDLRKNSGGGDSGPGQFVMVPTSPKPSRQSSQKCAGYEKKVNERRGATKVLPLGPVRSAGSKGWQTRLSGLFQSDDW